MVGSQPGARMVCPTCYRDSLPGRESQKDGLGTVKREIARKGSPQPEAVPRTRHTHRSNRHSWKGHTENAHRPQAAVSRQTQYAAPKEVNTHMHTPATTNPQDSRTQRTAAATLALGEPTRPAHPTPAAPGSQTGSAPARPCRTDGTPVAAATSAAAATAQTHQSRPRSDTPTPATPASVAASLNPNRNGARSRLHTPAPAAHRSVAASPNPDRRGAFFGDTTGKVRHRSVAASPNLDRIGSVPARGLGQSPAASPPLMPPALP